MPQQAFAVATVSGNPAGGRCARVQGLAPDDDASEEAGDVFVGVTCLACGRLHFVNPKTGKTAGESSE
jgi:hypothetical protein